MKEQLEQKLLNEAAEQNNIDKICEIELSWGFVLALSYLYNKNKISKEDLDQVIKETKDEWAIGDLIFDMYKEEFDNKDLIN